METNKDRPVDESNHPKDEKEENKNGLETNPGFGKEKTEKSKETNIMVGEENDRGKEENDLRSVTAKKKGEERQKKAKTTAQVAQGLIIGGSVAIIVVGVILVINNYQLKAPSFTNTDITLSGDNTASFRFDVKNTSKMSLRFEAKSSFGTSSIALPDPWTEKETEGVGYVKSADDEYSYTVEGSIPNLRYGTTYNMKVIGNNKISDKTYLSSKLVTSSFDENVDFGLYWECHCVTTGYCDYQLLYPETDNSYKSFTINLEGKKKQEPFSLLIDSDLHKVHTFKSIDKSPGEYTATIVATKTDDTTSTVKVATVAI